MLSGPLIKRKKEKKIYKRKERKKKIVCCLFAIQDIVLARFVIFAFGKLLIKSSIYLNLVKICKFY